MGPREAVALALCGAENVFAERRTGAMPTKCKSACADCIAAADAAISAHLKALTDANMVVVPREPTEAMIAHGEAAFFTHFTAKGSGKQDPMPKVYRAMIQEVDNG